MSDEDKTAAMNRLKAAVVLLVGASAALITLSGGGSLLEVAGAAVAGLVVGAILLAYLSWIL
ncbi:MULTISPECIES: hypothetical protein [Halorussus]|uniref:hypothetical protein n=1 Tax=Halorussus TaxID=1070314 RepID=UPI00209EA616|nr:hypothetical protein [Halorussus vallis]USZ76911.1 hypothetical protein NGM07_06170 [Halorussus vallis]